MPGSSAVIEEEGRPVLWIFRTYSSVLSLLCGGIIWLLPSGHVRMNEGQLLLRLSLCPSWSRHGFLQLFNQFLNSAYVVSKIHQPVDRGRCRAICVMNYFFIKWWGPISDNGGFLLRSGHRVRAARAGCPTHDRHVHPRAGWRRNPQVLAGEALLLLAEPPLYGLWTGLLTAAIILFNFAGVWAMARMLLPKLLGRRGRALVSAVDNWIKK